MPQLQINQGPQDALLYDNSKSYFTNVGYVRTSNFQMELRDISSQNNAALGQTVQWVIPKAADLLGPVDLVVDFSAGSGPGAGAYASFVESVGHAMLEKITLSVGSNDIETITGEQLHIINELMRTNESRLGKKQILKTGSSAVRLQKKVSEHACAPITEADNGRLIGIDTVAKGGQQLIVPLGLFFTKHPSQYFPLAAIAGCNDVRISIKFRPLKEIVQLGYHDYVSDSTTYLIDGDQTATAGAAAAAAYSPSISFDNCKLRCHYIHVTGPEATTLMNKEHVRLMKPWGNPQQATIKAAAAGSACKLDMDLSFLHPVQELVIVIRKRSEINGSTMSVPTQDSADQGAVTKNYFAFHGSGTDPNVDSLKRRVVTGDDMAVLGTALKGIDADAKGDSTLQLKDIKLTLNGQERHPGLDNSAIDRNYLMNRLIPMLHSNTSTHFLDVPQSDASIHSLAQLAEQLDRKEIYVYPFAIAPENQNPSGAVNFSKVSHAKLTMNFDSIGTTANEEFQADVWGVHYNWLQIKDGRALTSFA
jgi:hypothetical protein